MEEKRDSAANDARYNQTLLFTAFLRKVKIIYYQLHHQNVIYDPEVDRRHILRVFRPYNPSPLAILRRTVITRQLMKEFLKLKLDRNSLTPRLRKAKSQLKHFLENSFGHPFEEHYLAGDWLMGPNIFCWQPICNVVEQLSKLLKMVDSPKSIEEFQRIGSIIEHSAHAFRQYTDNMRLGVKVGMVHSQLACRAGVDAFKTRHRRVVEHGKEGELS